MLDTAIRAQGWYVDPYRQHEARWFSDGTPTALVRDGGVESRDDPPDRWSSRQLEPVTHREDRLVPTRGSSDAGVDAAWRFFVSTGGD